ncbi:uncharacterized protein LOC111272338 [Varroa jacobsoni]|uniref:uncharacterized protein LOC111272338 n=1 Tax=Varroa jacobsoni TaxID=62625 RepID=UPI000BF885FE|nr:uncharacterized protein LOC111272338 [Varroa jacobsoni]
MVIGAEKFRGRRDKTTLRHRSTQWAHDHHPERSASCVTPEGRPAKGTAGSAEGAMPHLCAKRHFKMATSMNGVLKKFFHVYRPLFNTNEAFITKMKRATYVRLYPTMLVQPDGSTFTIRYHEPRQIVQMPLRFDELSPEEKQIVLLKRRPKEIMEKKIVFTTDFDSKKYRKYVTNRKPINN